MTERLIGVETEYAASGITREGLHLDRHHLVEELMRYARRTLAGLPDLGGVGLFLENGSRFYIDYGMHPELSTPECTNPTDVVRYIVAGDAILADLARQVETESATGWKVMIFKSNVDYSGAFSTWGCHESYLHRTFPATLSRQIIPHLVSRVIYSGAGGFNPLSPGIEFTLSPRAHHLQRAVSENSTSDRGIFHTKDEPLSREGYHRLHIICGESLSSQTAMWLKLATTALVVAMAEAGACPADEVQLRSPVDALQAFARDPQCRKQVGLIDGSWTSAIAIQRHYLEQAQIYVNEPCMPDWAEEACGHWARMLDRLEKEVESLETTLDWAIKQALYKDMARREGVDWQTLPQWNQIITSLRKALDRTEEPHRPLSAEFVLSRKSPVRDAVTSLEPMLRETELRWEGLDPFLKLRQKLFEIDTKFAQLEKGIFTSLEQAGVLEHQLPGIDPVDRFTRMPPVDGRARIRGEVIRRLAKDPHRYGADWQGVLDHDEGRVLDLSDPFETSERWVRLEDIDEYSLVGTFGLQRYPNFD